MGTWEWKNAKCKCQIELVGWFRILEWYAGFLEGLLKFTRVTLSIRYRKFLPDGLNPWWGYGVSKRWVNPQKIWQILGSI